MVVITGNSVYRASSLKEEEEWSEEDEPQHLYLLKKEELKKIAKSIQSVHSDFPFDSDSLRSDRLPALQDRCFKALYQLCEEEEWDKLNRIKSSIGKIQDTAGKTIFFELIREKKSEIINKILEKGLEDTLSSDTFKKEALHHAAKAGLDGSLIKQIKRKGGGNVFSLDSKQRLPFHYALKNGYDHLVPSLYPKKDGVVFHSPYRSAKYEKIPPIGLAIVKGKIKCIDEIFKLDKRCFSSIASAMGGTTALHLAIGTHQNKVLHHLLTKYPEYAKDYMESPNSEGLSPLTLAIITGNTGAVIDLIKKGAHLETRDHEGKTALHHAALLGSISDICILAKAGANLKAEDMDHKTPLAYLDKDEKLKNFYINLVSDISYLESIEPNAFCDCINTMVFKGGGPKAIAFLGAVRGIEQEREIFKNIKRFAGTSGGAITASLLAVGMDTDEASKLFRQTPVTYFLDHPFNKERFEDIVKKNANVQTLKETYEAISASLEKESPGPALKAAAKKLLLAIWNSTGVCEGKKFLEWIESEIYKRTNIHHCTFGELAKLIEEKKRNPQGKPFKHLHVFATQIGQEFNILQFNSEDPRWKDLIISDAVRASMSIPLVFEAYVPLFKSLNSEGEYMYHTQNNTFKGSSHEEIRKKVRDAKSVGEASYLDGGLIKNFPVDRFDERQYIYEGVPTEKKNYPQFNRGVLAFSLISPESEVTVERGAETIGDVLKGVFQVYRHAEFLLGKLDSYNFNRVIALSNEGIRLYNFNTSPFEGKGKKAVEAAEAKVKEVLNKKRAIIQGFLSLASLDEGTSEEEEEDNRVENPLALHNSVPNNSEFKLVWSTLIHRKIDPYLIRSGLLRPSGLITIAVNYFLPYYLTGKNMQFMVARKSYSRNANAYQFEWIKKFNPALELFNHIKGGSIEWKVNDVYNQNQTYFNHPHFSKTILPLLIFDNNEKQIEFLVNKGIPVNVVDEDQTPITFLAARFGCNEALKALLKASDYDETVVDQEENTLLHVMAEENNKEGCEIALKNQKVKSLINKTNKAKKTSLQIALDHKHFDIVKTLIGCNRIKLKKHVSESGETVIGSLVKSFKEASRELDFISMYQIKNIINFLFKNTDASKIKEIILLENKTEDSLLFMIEDRDILKLLIENGIELKKYEKETGRTLLYLLAKRNELDLVKLFCEKYKVQHPNSFSRFINKKIKSSEINRSTGKSVLKTALTIAIEKNNSTVVKELIDRGADFRSKVDQQTPLQVAEASPLRMHSLKVLKNVLART